MPCSIEIGGRLPDRLVSDLARAIEADGANDDWVRELPDDYKKLMRDGAILDLFNSHTDEMSALEEFCVKHDLTFRRHTGQPCGADEDPHDRVYEPGMDGPGRYLVSSEGDALVRLKDPLSRIREVEQLASLVVPPLTIVRE
jgi:hypothetical protein